MLRPYHAGVLAAKQQYKLADEEEGGPRARHVAALGAGTLPFAGAIGEKPLPRNRGIAVSSPEELRQHITPGDVILSGSPGMSRNKAWVSAASGEPKGYHVSVAGGTRSGVTGFQTTSSGPSFGSIFGVDDGRASAQVLRFKGTPEQRQANLQRLAQSTQASYATGEALTTRLIEAGVAPEKAKEWAAKATASTYAEADGLAAGLRSLFLPKWRSESALQQESARMHAAQDAYAQGGPERVAKQFVDYVKRQEAAGKPVDPTYARRLIPKEMQGVCSTMPAKQMLTRLGLGKGADSILPSDYLRSPAFEPAAYFSAPVSPRNQRVDRVLRHAPTAIRGATGVGLAGLTLGAGKLYDHLQKKHAPPPPTG